MLYRLDLSVQSVRPELLKPSLSIFRNVKLDLTAFPNATVVSLKGLQPTAQQSQLSQLKVQSGLET